MKYMTFLSYNKRNGIQRRITNKKFGGNEN